MDRRKQIDDELIQSINSKYSSHKLVIKGSNCTSPAIDLLRRKIEVLTYMPSVEVNQRHGGPRLMEHYETWRMVHDAVRSPAYTREDKRVPARLEDRRHTPESIFAIQWQNEVLAVGWKFPRAVAAK